jgi:peroxiredoxin
VAAVSLAVPVFSAEVPRPAPQISIDMPDGSKLPLNKYKGKVIVLEFLLTDCPHCQQCSQTVSRLNKEYGPKGLQPIGAAINADAAAKLQNFIQQNGVNYPVGLFDNDKAHEFLQHSVMMAMPMPQLVFIDRKGVIRSQYSGNSPFFTDEERNMRAAIEELLKEPAGAAPAHTASTKGKK